jgi:hypothetical protein
LYSFLHNGLIGLEIILIRKLDEKLDSISYSKNIKVNLFVEIVFLVSTQIKAYIKYWNRKGKVILSNLKVFFSSNLKESTLFNYK